MDTRIYCNVSAIVFSLVALAHFFRLIFSWPVTVDDTSISMLVSVFGTLVPGGLAFVGFRSAKSFE